MPCVVGIIPYRRNLSPCLWLIFTCPDIVRKGRLPQGSVEWSALPILVLNHQSKNVLAIFQATVDQLTADFGTWETPWGEINRFQRLSGAIDAGFDDAEPSLPVGLASGRWGALAAYGARRGADTKRIYGYRGNSFVAVVEFGDKVRAKSLLAGGQSNDPDSPHFFDQAQPYIDVTFKDVPFYREEVEARAKRRYRPGEFDN